MLRASIVLATLETSHYRFQVAASSDAAALVLIAKAWSRHQQQTGAGPFIDFQDDVQIQHLHLETVYRDGLPLCAAHEPTTA